MTKINRIEKARNLAKGKFTKIATRDMTGRAKTIFVPGSEAKGYEVILRRKKHFGHTILTAECRLMLGAAGFDWCKGNAQTVCYHSIAAVLTAAFEVDIQASVCLSYQDAEKLARMGKRRIVRVETENTHKAIFLVIRDPEGKVAGEQEKKQTPEEILEDLGFGDHRDWRDEAKKREQALPAERKQEDKLFK